MTKDKKGPVIDQPNITQFNTVAIPANTSYLFLAGVTTPSSVTSTSTSLPLWNTSNL